MSYEFANSVCTALPGAEMSHPFGDDHDVWKVGGKIFAAITPNEGASVKTADVETAALIKEMGHGVHAPYFHKSWVRVNWGMVPEEELRERIETAYGLMRSSLSKKAQAELPPLA